MVRLGLYDELERHSSCDGVLVALISCFFFRFEISRNRCCE